MGCIRLVLQGLCRSFRTALDYAHPPPIYRGDPAAWHFPPVKTGTLDFTNPDKAGLVGYWDTTFDAPWFLLITSMTHYLTYVTQFAVALAYFNSTPAGAVALPFLLVAGPLFQAMGGAGPNVMHEYEGFQVWGGV